MVLEKSAHSQLMEHLETTKRLDPKQTGFRRFNSTQTALLKLTDDIRTGMDKKLMTIILLFAFSKAFDTILPSRLLEKLRLMGFSRAALLWINSYFEGVTMQRVSTKLSGECSWLSTNLGVPKGSVLGPLLFCLYINCDRVTWLYAYTYTTLRGYCWSARSAVPGRSASVIVELQQWPRIHTPT